MSDPDRLAEIKARWFTADRHMPEYWHDLASRDIPWLVKTVERLRGLLARLEWVGGDDFGAACPECQGYRDSKDGHDPGCELVAALHPEGKEAPPLS